MGLTHPRRPWPGTARTSPSRRSRTRPPRPHAGCSPRSIGGVPAPSRPAKPVDSPLRASHRAALHLRALRPPELLLLDSFSPPPLARHSRENDSRMATARSRRAALYLKALRIPEAIAHSSSPPAARYGPNFAISAISDATAAASRRV